MYTMAENYPLYHFEWTMGEKRMKHTEAEVENTVDAVDRISNLPDELLTIVLSFVSTKDSVRTSVLSTRWKPLWASVPILKLRDTDFCAEGDNDKADKNRIRAKFTTYVDRFLMQIDPSSVRKIHLKIHLLCSMCYDLSLIESWIFLAKERNVEELIFSMGFYLCSEKKVPCAGNRMDLEITRVQLDPLVPYVKDSSYTGKLGLLILDDDADLPIVESWVNFATEFNLKELVLHLHDVDMFPQALFMWESLEVLDLDGCDVILSCPMASISFPNVKVLRMSNIIYKDDNSVSNLINSSCPILEELELLKCDDDGLESLNIISHTLKRLEVYSSSLEPGYSSYTTRTRIDAPALRYLSLRDRVTKNFVLGDFSELVEADLDIRRTYFSRLHNRTHSGAVDLLQKMSNVECLSLSCHTMTALQKTNAYEFKTFHNLTRLKIGNGCDSSSKSKSVSWKLVLELLESSPKLEALIFEVIRFRVGEEFSSTQGQDPPICLGHLKTLEICFYSSNKRELEWVGYFLTNCRALKRMTITYSSRCLNLKAFEQAVLALPRGSTECQIQVP